MSHSEIRYRDKEAKLEITLHIFIDDLEADLTQTGHSGLHLGTPRESARADSLIRNYLDQHFRLRSDKKQLKPVWLGKEISDDLAAFWIYLEIPHVKPFHTLLLENSILCNLYADQQNVVRVFLDKEHEGYVLLTPQKRNYEIQWKP